MPQWIIFILTAFLVGVYILSSLGSSAGAGNAPAAAQAANTQGIPSQASGPGTGSQRNLVCLHIGTTAPCEPGGATAEQLKLGSGSTQSGQPAQTTQAAQTNGTSGNSGQGSGAVMVQGYASTSANQNSGQNPNQATAQNTNQNSGANQNNGPYKTTANAPQADQPVIATNSRGMPVILFKYVVQPGDTLSSIARRYHSSVNLILQQNGSSITNPDRLVPGQVIYIPDP